MAFEIKEVLRLNLRTRRFPKIAVADVAGTDITISAVTFQLVNSKTQEVVISGDGTYQNDDTDPAGRTIKTVQATLDLTTTDNVDIPKGNYSLSFHITLSTSESDVISWPVKIVDFQEG